MIHPGTREIAASGTREMGKRPMIDGIEIDFLPTGETQGSADSLVVRWNDDGVLRVLVYNGGGSRESGMAVVRHVKRLYGSDRVDYVVAAFLDQRHVGGLSEVLEHLNVGELWIHQPWKYSEALTRLLGAPVTGLSKAALRARRELSPAAELVETARKKGVLVQEAFAGSTIGVFTVLSPGHDAYLKHLLPTLLNELVPGDRSVLARLWRRVADMATSFVSGAALAAMFSFGPGRPAPLGGFETSVTLHTSFYGHGVLLLGCAGESCIRASCDYANDNGLSLGESLQFVQIPNGARSRKVQNDVLDRLLGLPVAPADARRDGRVAHVSAHRLLSAHPRRALIAEFERRGFRVSATRGSSLRKVLGEMPERSEWVPQAFPRLLSRTES